MATNIKINAEGVDAIAEAMAAYGQGAGRKLQEVLGNEGAMHISETIHGILPVSGRTFKGHTRGAKASPVTSVFGRYFEGDTTLVVQSRPKFGYLVFPNDGRGQSAQQFMERGLDAAKDKVIEMCVARLTEEI